MDLQPIREDPTAALALATQALRRRPLQAVESPFVSALERRIGGGEALGVLRLDGGFPVGIAVWDAPNALGVTLELFYLAEGRRSPESYRSFFEEVAAVAGPIAFAPGGLVGLTETEEALMMRALRFASFARTEMRYPPDAPVPDAPPGSAAAVRDTRPEDEPALARLHSRAYGSTFDRYLFLVEADLARDSAIAIRDILGGRYGEFLPWASPIVVDGSEILGAVLVVRAPYGPLIADVMVDPATQGRGLGRTLLAASVRALRGRGESMIVLNVTDGNRRARRLYDRLGFVTSLGPGMGWYSTERIPVPPETD